MQLWVYVISIRIVEACSAIPFLVLRRLLHIFSIVVDSIIYEQMESQDFLTIKLRLCFLKKHVGKLSMKFFSSYITNIRNYIFLGTSNVFVKLGT